MIYLKVFPEPPQTPPPPYPPPTPPPTPPPPPPPPTPTPPLSQIVQVYDANAKVGY